MSSPAFSGDQVAKTPHSECRGLCLIPGGGTGSCTPQLRSQHAATKRAHVSMTLAKRPKWTSTVWRGCITQRGLPTSPDYQLSWWTIFCDGLYWAFDPEERWSSSKGPGVSQGSMRPWGPVSDTPLSPPASGGRCLSRPTWSQPVTYITQHHRSTFVFQNTMP